VLDKAVYSAFESMLNSSIVSYRIMDVDVSSLQADSQLKSRTWPALRFGIGAESAFITWTEWTPTMAKPAWQHFRYCNLCNSGSITSKYHYAVSQKNAPNLKQYSSKL